MLNSFLVMKRLAATYGESRRGVTLREYRKVNISRAWYVLEFYIIFYKVSYIGAGPFGVNSLICNLCNELAISLLCGVKGSIFLNVFRRLSPIDFKNLCLA